MKQEKIESNDLYFSASNCEKQIDTLAGQLFDSTFMYDHLDKITSILSELDEMRDRLDQLADIFQNWG